MTIACALKWGVASIEVYSIRHCSPRRGTPFQVQGVCRETVLTRGRHCEESLTKYFDICFCVKSVVIKLLRTMVL